MPIDLATALPELAARDPRLAYQLAQSGLGADRIYTLSATFTSGAVDQQAIESNVLPNFCTSDLLIYDLSYQVRRPNAYAGALLKPQSDHFNALGPGINVTLQVAGGADYFIARDAPIELVARHASADRPSRCGCYWALAQCETPQAIFSLARVLAPEELPTTVILALHAVRLRSRMWDNMSAKVAMQRLVDAGLVTPGGLAGPALAPGGFIGDPNKDPLGGPPRAFSTVSARPCKSPWPVEVVSAGASSARAGVFSSPAPGDATESLLEVPRLQLPGVGRYLFRLAAAKGPACSRLRIDAVRLAVRIGDDLDGGRGGSTYRLARTVTDPFWSFPDGNVSFHLRWFVPTSQKAFDASGPPPASASPDYYGTAPALLYLPGPAGIVPYAAPAAGLLPGEPLGGWGTVLDLRWPWTPASHLGGPCVEGPVVVGLYASVRQTDPATRALVPAGPPDDALLEEDRFVRAVPSAVYLQVGGAISFSVEPECCERPCP